MHSMTGCGKGLAEDGRFSVTVELKSVNHRYLDISPRIPRAYAFLEDAVRRQLSGSLHRGHVDVTVTVLQKADADVRLSVDEALAAAYLRAGETLSRMGAGGRLCVQDLLVLDGVVAHEDAPVDEDTVRALTSEACASAISGLIQMRQAEGVNLKRDLEAHLERVAGLRQQILEIAPSVVESYRQRLEEKLNQLLPAGSPVDPARLAQEVLLFADRCAIDEELSRLESHIRQFTRYMDSAEETGKKLDFLCQELNREANTIGSKANDAFIAHLVVELKAEIEKLREQVQNVE
ncbi:MAG: YicC family protein [Clostridia bacterium]|nr:YicC family protein [Clostridia bacterium]